MSLSLMDIRRHHWMRSPQLWSARALLRGGEPLVLQQGLDDRRPAEEALEEGQGLLRAPAREHLVAEGIAIGASEPTVLVEPLATVARQHLAPDVRVVRGGIAARE